MENSSSVKRKADDSSSSENEFDDEEKNAVWVDEDDIFTTQEVNELQGRKINLGSKAANDYKQTLEERYKSIMGAPKWAKKKRHDSTLLSQAGRLIIKERSLKKDTIEIQKLKDINRQTIAGDSIIKSVLFHPGSTVALVAGIKCMVSLYQVDGKENTKLQSIKYRRFPISCAAFLRKGDEFIIGSRHHKYFYCHDLIAGKSHQVSNSMVDITNMKNFSVSPDGRIIAVCGRFGEIYLLSGTSKEYITTLRMNGEACSVDFHNDKMYSHGSDGEVYVWNMNTRDCVHKFLDEGCLTGSSIAASPNGKLLACGSSSGVVNIYDLNRAQESKSPAPLKTLYNLVTEVDSLKFNATSEVLCFASQEKNNAIKLLHCQSMTVFSNFPAFKSKFHRVQCVDFSPNSGFLAFGDNSKTAHLFRLKYYGNY